LKSTLDSSQVVYLQITQTLEQCIPIIDVSFTACNHWKKWVNEVADMFGVVLILIQMITPQFNTSLN